MFVLENMPQLKARNDEKVLVQYSFRQNMREIQIFILSFFGSFDLYVKEQMLFLQAATTGFDLA